MKIGIVTNLHEPTEGGGHSFQKRVLREILQTPTHHNFILLNYGALVADFFPHKLPEIKINFSGSYTDNGASDLSIAVREHELELVWFTSQVSEVASCPTFVTVWDTLHRSQPWFPEVSYEGWKWEERETYYRAILPRSARIITGTEFEGKRISKIYNVPEENIAVIPMPGPGDDELSVPGRSKRELLEHLAVDKPYFLYPAQFWAHKNHITLIAVWERLKRLVEPSKLPYLLLTGADKGNLDHVLNRIETLGLTAHVRNLGFVTQSDLKGLYENAEALVYSSLAGPDNLPPLEAFAYRCPVIASKNPGCEEQLLDCAVLVNPLSVEAWAEQICGILDDPDKRKSLTEKGFDRYLELRPSHYVSKLLNLFDGFSQTRDLWGFSVQERACERDTEAERDETAEIALEYEQSSLSPENSTVRPLGRLLRFPWESKLTSFVQRRNQESISEGDISEKFREISSTNSDVELSADVDTIRSVGVDLTPMLPGGSNGGAKVFIIGLLQNLSKIAPDTNFVLLTREETHEELSSLDRPNMRRNLVRKRDVLHQRTQIQNIGSMLFSMVPLGLRRSLISRGSFLLSSRKRQMDKLLEKPQSFDLLFCPFSAPVYHAEGTPTVSIFYDLQHMEYPQFFDQVELAHRDLVISEMCKKSDFIAAISHFSRETLLSRTGISPEKVIPIPICLHPGPDTHKRGASDILKRLELSPKRYFLYPANFWRHKNHEILFTAFGLAKDSGFLKGIQLVCTGHSDNRQQKLKRVIKAMGLDKEILCPGFVTDTELKSLLTHSRALVFPSLYEGFGMPVVEAMSRGVPVACSNGSALREVVGEAGLMFDPRNPFEIADTLKALAVDDHELRSRIIIKGLEQASKFMNMDGMAEQYLGLLLRAWNENRNKYRLTNVFSDGWCEKTIRLKLAKTKRGGKLTLSLMLPKWLSTSKGLQVDLKIDDELYLTRQIR